MKTILAQTQIEIEILFNRVYNGWVNSVAKTYWSKVVNITENWGVNFSIWEVKEILGSSS